MNTDIKNYIEKYDVDIQNLFLQLRQLIFQSVSCEIEEKFWAKLPSYYVCGKFIRIIPFKDHINVEAKAVIEHKNQLEGFKITPKGMMQIYLGQKIPNDILKAIFHETLLK